MNVAPNRRNYECDCERTAANIAAYERSRRAEISRLSQLCKVLKYTKKRSNPERGKEKEKERAVRQRARYRALDHVDRQTKGGTRPRSLTSSSRRRRARRWYRVTLAVKLARSVLRARARARVFALESPADRRNATN